MSITNSQRYREAVLMAAVEDDGLEELVLRLVEGRYPKAYRTGPGKDGGVDVLSDLGNPPQRGWQAKNFGASIKWGACGKSLASAMKGAAPGHYTFVFPRKLRAGELKHWREEFQPTELAKYEGLKRLDLEDDLAWQLKDHPKLLDDMTGGALAEYIGPIIAELTKTGVSPFAPPGGRTATGGVAKQALEMGKRDASFSYELRGREAGRGDTELGDPGARFILDHSPDQLPTYALAVREGEAVTELRAEPREGVEIDAPEPWFSPDEAGEEARMLARMSLAKGRPIELSGDAVGVRPGQVPERFRDQLRDGLLRSGTLSLGVSEVLPLTVELGWEGQLHRQVLPLYRVPPLEDGSLSYGAALGGAALFLDMKPLDGVETAPGQIALDLLLSLNLAVAGETGKSTLGGLGFARAFARAESLLLTCPGLLPEEGVRAETGAGEETNEELWEAAAVIAAALAGLEGRDGQRRKMPESVGRGDRSAAQVIYLLLTEGRAEIPLPEGELQIPFPREVAAVEDAADLLDISFDFPPVAGNPTGLAVRQQIQDVEPLETVHAASGQLALKARAGEHGGRVVVTLREPAGAKAVG